MRRQGTIVYDSDRAAGRIGVRGAATVDRTLFISFGEFAMEVTIQTGRDARRFLYGQVMENPLGTPVHDLPVRLVGSEADVSTDEFGQFALSVVPTGAFYVLHLGRSGADLVCQIPVSA